MSEREEVGAFTTYHVLEGAPVVRVYHDRDGDWQFMADVSTRVEDGRLVGINHLLELDPTLKGALSIPEGWYAYRESPTDEWAFAEDPD
ncbi:hypothetical protein [Goodfellowiella coeruleoviolacea]|uniref:hypothetical protein n=1 Tax=Goodfellowiella coeruleoviolacea TaxID=334858 RepID=UPI0020A3B7C3|nr:hypothetical protein [Goodfellowiella coeruleoviolacea]